MAAFRFGVDSFIWTEVFSEKDIWILPKAKELGFDVVDLAIAHPESFPLEKVLEAKRQTGLELVTTTTLGLDTNLISPVNVGDGVYIAAGSTITEDIPENSLSIARARQVNKEGWKDKRK